MRFHNVKYSFIFLGFLLFFTSCDGEGLKVEQFKSQASNVNDDLSKAFVYSSSFRDSGTPLITQNEYVSNYDSLGSGYYKGAISFTEDAGLSPVNGPLCMFDPTQCSQTTMVDPVDFLTCGTSQSSISERIDHCQTINGSISTWSGKDNGTFAHSDWKLVVHMPTGEQVWRDERTKVLWSSQISPPGGWSWCQGADVYTDGCAGETPQAGGVCDDSLFTDEKGGLTESNSGVVWRMPSMGDTLQFAADGGMLTIVPDGFWSSSSSSTARGLLVFAMVGDPLQLSFQATNVTTTSISFICMGFEK